eukprot:4391291-Prymnesium_polylepis.1
MAGRTERSRSRGERCLCRVERRDPVEAALRLRPREAELDLADGGDELDGIGKQCDVVSRVRRRNEATGDDKASA